MVLLLAWLTLLPTRTALPVSSQRRDINPFLVSRKSPDKPRSGCARAGFYRKRRSYRQGARADDGMPKRTYWVAGACSKSKNCSGQRGAQQTNRVDHCPPNLRQRPGRRSGLPRGERGGGRTDHRPPRQLRDHARQPHRSATSISAAILRPAAIPRTSRARPADLACWFRIPAPNCGVTAHSPARASSPLPIPCAPPRRIFSPASTEPPRGRTQQARRRSDVAHPADRVPLTPDAMRHVFHPVSAFDSSCDGQGTPDGKAICNRSIPVFDGWVRYDVALSYKETTNFVGRAGGSTDGPAIICQARYVPVGGHRLNTFRQSCQPRRKPWAFREFEISIYACL